MDSTSSLDIDNDNSCDKTIETVIKRSDSDFFTSPSNESKDALDYNLQSSYSTLQPSLDSTFQPSLDWSFQPSLDSSLQPSLDSTLQPSLDSTLQSSLDSTYQPTEHHF
uniref:Uncharacterized protein n=1 Tax=Eucampia antarctica TaxID=49252 RepID=A0A7S2RBM6_9STRA|mmetsp:Transcript_20013/g.19271  ORF Transcript_20013/g.19271 Transcript_20013/m.19271 type:complete len:109 (+) Transcript_20013:2-328(+)